MWFKKVVVRCVEVGKKAEITSSRAVREWSILMHRNNQQYTRNSWRQELEEAYKRYKDFSMCARFGRLGMAVTIYCIW